MRGLVILIIAAIALSFMAYAAPVGPDQITKTSNERRTVGIDNSSGGTKIQAQAGNITALRINSTRLTSRWQGYYGNITGTITLDDANNNTMISWNLASPRGEIYASNGSTSGIVDWSNVFCFNYTNNLSAGANQVQKFNGTDVERMIGAREGEIDNVNSTFNATFSGNFQVGGNTINGQSGCRQATLYVNDQYQTADFVEVLLTDNSSIIFTALLEQDEIGFQGSAVDFQMIVGENGDVEGSSTYYFFVELT